MRSTVAEQVLLNRADQFGFSMIELIVTLSLMAIIVTLAFTSYEKVLEKRRLSSMATKAVSMIQNVQGESIKRNLPMTVVYTRTSNFDWCIGVVSGTNPCDCAELDESSSGYCTVGGSPQTIRSVSANPEAMAKSMTGDGTFAFNPVNGMLLNSGDSMVIDLRSWSESFRLALTVSPTGLVSLCSQDVAHQVPGYEICP